MLVIPTTSVLVVLTCKTKYIPIYIVSSLVLSIIATAFDVISSLVFVLPVLAVGISIGFLMKSKIPTSLSIVITALLNVGFIYLSIEIIELIFDVNLFDLTLSILNIKSSIWLDRFTPSLIFIYSVAECLFVQFIVLIFGETIGLTIIKNPAISKYFPYFTAVLAVISFVLSLFSYTFGYFVLTLSLALGAISIFEVFRKGYIINFVLLICLSFISFITVPIVLPLLEPECAVLLLLLLPLSIAIAGMFTGRYTINDIRKED